MRDLSFRNRHVATPRRAFQIEAAETLEPAAQATRESFVSTLTLRARQLELGHEGAIFREGEGAAGVRIEQVLGRTIERSTDKAFDFVDSILGRISLKGPLPATGNIQGLIDSAIWDATKVSGDTLIVDLFGLSAQDAATVKNTIQSTTVNAQKRIFFIW